MDFAGQQRYKAWLAASGILSRPCPSCGPVTWEGVRLAALAALDREGDRWCAELAGAIVPVVALTCPKCRLVVTYSLEAGGPFATPAA